MLTCKTRGVGQGSNTNPPHATCRARVGSHPFQRHWQRTTAGLGRPRASPPASCHPPQVPEGVGRHGWGM